MSQYKTRHQQRLELEAEMAKNSKSTFQSMDTESIDVEQVMQKTHYNSNKAFAFQETKKVLKRQDSFELDEMQHPGFVKEIEMLDQLQAKKKEPLLVQQEKVGSQYFGSMGMVKLPSQELKGREYDPPSPRETRQGFHDRGHLATNSFASSSQLPYNVQGNITAENAVVNQGFVREMEMEAQRIKNSLGDEHDVYYRKQVVDRHPDKTPKEFNVSIFSKAKDTQEMRVKKSVNITNPNMSFDQFKK